MKRIKLFAALALSAVLLFTNLYMTEKSQASGSAYIVINAEDNKVLMESNAQAHLPMASTTKVMTALIVLENAPTDLLVTVPEDAVRVEGSSMYLKEGEELTVLELLYGLMLSSGNDAALALAYAVGGTPEGFVELMNEKAQVLGLKNTHFVNPHGLHDADHYTSAYDLALICSEAMKNEIFREIVATKDKKFENPDTGEIRYLHNKNKLLANYKGANGIKIGFTKAAARCLCASAKRGDIQLICVVLNDGNWFNRAAELMDAGFISLGAR